VDVVPETVIRRPVAQVAAYAGDPANAPEWYVNIDPVEWRTAPPVTVGSRMDFVARFLGRRLAGSSATASPDRATTTGSRARRSRS
jgi:hypothetical protein